MRYLLTLALFACGSAKPATQVSEPEHVAPPFSVADLRAGLPAGTEIKLRVEAAGKPPVIQHWRFTAADDRGCTIHARILDAEGQLIRDEGSGTSTWAELLTHAQFPAAHTTRSDSSVEVPAGRFETYYFEVNPAKPGDPLRRLHFARELPGPPIFMEVVKDGAVVMKMVLLSRTP